MRRRLLVVAALVTGVGAFLAVDPGERLEVLSYDAIDAHTLRMTTCTSAPELTWTRVSRVEETATEVEVTVKAFQLPLPVGQSCETLDFIVTLEDPIGDREVNDGTNVVPRRHGSARVPATVSRPVVG